MSAPGAPTESNRVSCRFFDIVCHCIEVTHIQQSAASRRRGASSADVREAMVNGPRRVNPKQASGECEKLAMPGRSVSLRLTSGFAVGRPVSPRSKGSFSIRSEIKTNLHKKRYGRRESCIGQEAEE